MKYNIFLCLATCLLLIACSSKKEAIIQSTGISDLSGTWELREAQNGRAPTVQYPPGNRIRFLFTATTFEQYDKNTLVRKGNYSLVPDATASETVGLGLPDGEFAYRLVLEGNTAEKTFIERRGDTLLLLSGYFPTDGGSRQVYVKTATANQ